MSFCIIAQFSSTFLHFKCSVSYSLLMRRSIEPLFFCFITGLNWNIPWCVLCITIQLGLRFFEIPKQFSEWSVCYSHEFLLCFLTCQSGLGCLIIYLTQNYLKTRVIQEFVFHKTPQARRLEMLREVGREEWYHHCWLMRHLSVDRGIRRGLRGA